MGEYTLNGVTRIEGIVEGADGATLGLVARWFHPRVGRKYDAMHASYAVPVSGIEQLEVWRVSPKRTALLLGSVTLAFVAFFELAPLGQSGTSGGGGGGGTEQSIRAPR